MVGTIFVNFLANTLSLSVRKLKLELPEKELAEIFGNSELHLGGVQFGQPRSISAVLSDSLSAKLNKDTRLRIVVDCDGLKGELVLPIIASS